METRWKFLNGDNETGELSSEHGEQAWIVGQWETVDGEVELCYNGFHCSEKMIQAFSYVQGDRVAKVEVRGNVDSSDDKQAWRSMRLVDVRRWTKRDSVALSIFSARLILGNFENEFPDDDRPRKAIEAAEIWLTDPSTEMESAAWSARSAASAAWSAAWSAASAASAAWSAASAAESAARSAASAESAAWSARSAAESAARSARSAAESALYGQIEEWMTARFETLERVNNE